MNKQTETAFVIVSASGYWGKGGTLAEAAKNCNKEGASAGDNKIVAFAYVGEPEKLKEIHVVGGGEISYPGKDVISIRLFGSLTKIRLSQLMRDKEPGT